ncbi:hypothetical protein FNV43_RR24900 [Rhamnella rubrinervis]|uniref:Ubiquitin-like protease family profile domain-containing protein n=1 Tax=Rhamnella rubrinervis TaxID=2594499 RepID=A0A8K0GLN1_9ROSA|nr:hypothetical protein FNV43_RR24900 [Rhamnella rubrinervis]
MATRTTMAPFKRLTKASEKQASSKQSASTPKPITRKIKEKENPKGTKKVAESPSPPPVEKRRRCTVEEQAPTKTTTTSASTQECMEACSCGQAASCGVVKRLIPVDKKYHAHLTSNSNITFAFDVIKNKLSKGMDKLKDSFVENFLELKTVQFCGGFIHLLLLNQVECDDTNVMEFDFHGIGARFDRKSFTMITGLNCGKFSNEKELEHFPYDLWVKYFGDTGLISQSDFIKAFEDLDFDESDEEVENNVKCCMFYFLETVLLTGDKKRMVRNRNFNIIQNNELCDRYPWGNLLYDVTISNLRSRIKEGEQIANYSVSGFPLAFQIWGFETILVIVTLAPCGKYHGMMCPRMLRWSCSSTLQYTKLAAEVFDRNDTASHPPSDQILDLKLLITELRSDLVAIRTELRFELRQQRNEIQNISSLVRQLVDQFVPKRAALTAFLDEQSTQFHVVEYDMMDKSSFNLILTNFNAWTICEISEEVSKRRGDELTKDADWEKEMRDSPFDMYAFSMLLVGSKSWLEIDYVYVRVNNDSKHWLVAKVDIRSRHITLYDFDISMSEDKFQCKNAKCLSVLFPYFLMVHGYYDYHSDLKSEGNYNLQLFSIKREDDPNLPQQTVLHMDLQDGREDRLLCRSAFYISSLLRLVRKDLQDGRSALPSCRAFLIQSSHLKSDW